MIIGTTLIYPGTTTDKYYSPAFPRGGEAATFTVEATFVNGTPTLVVAVEHRNEDEAAWAGAGTFANITAAGVENKDVTGLKELIRLSYSFSSGSSGDLVHVVVPAPAWRPY